MHKTKSGFHTIDALRFFAFLKVYLLHLPIDADLGLFNVLKKGGGIGVVFFFVLSGFLITHQLTKEIALNGNIDLKRFYLKRMLRIWPLFYLFLFILYLAPVHIKQMAGLIRPGYAADWRWSFSFLENYAIIIRHAFPAIGGLGITWSLCIEEHFYIIWGIMAVFTPAKKVILVLIAFITIAIIGRIICPIYFPYYDISTNEIITSLDYFAIGGIVGALYALYAHRFDIFILSIPMLLRWLYIIFTIFFVFAGSLIPAVPHIPDYLYPTIESLIFAVMIAIILPRQSPIRIEEKNVFSYLGRISYGLYLFHPIFILIFIQYCNVHHILIDNAKIVAFSIVFTFAPTVLTASFFYHFYEMPFLRLRKYIQ